MDAAYRESSGHYFPKYVWMDQNAFAPSKSVHTFYTPFCKTEVKGIFFKSDDLFCVRCISMRASLN